MPAIDPYGVLGVPPDASQAEIVSAYRRLVRRHHPDLRNGPGSDDLPGNAAGGDLDRILSAYAVLRDPGRRADHDRQRRRTAPSAAAQRRRPSYRSPPIQAGPVVWQPAAGARRPRSTPGDG